MKIGHICIDTQSDGYDGRFAALVEALDRLAVDQHVLVADNDLARRLRACPYVTVGPIVRSPVMACCLMPAVDLVHTHDAKSAQAGLLLTLTRSIPYVLSTGRGPAGDARPIVNSVLQRSRAQVAMDGLDSEALLAAYRDALAGESELPENSNCG